MSELDFSTQIEKAIYILKKGGVIVFPTETAYGLGADATNTRAVARLMAIKGREGWKTPPLIAANHEMVEKELMLSDQLQSYASKFWPGPLTIVAPVRPDSTLCAEVIREGTAAIRVSSEVMALELSMGLGTPIVATSANVAGEPTCYDAMSVHKQFDTRLLQPDLYLDVGVLPQRILSTIIAEQDGQVVVLRRGAIEISVIDDSSYVA